MTILLALQSTSRCRPIISRSICFCAMSIQVTSRISSPMYTRKIIEEYHPSKITIPPKGSYSTRSNRFGTGPDGRGLGTALIPIVGVAALLGTVFYFRNYINQIPDYETMKNDTGVKSENDLTVSKSGMMPDSKPPASHSSSELPVKSPETSEILASDETETSKIQDETKTSEIQDEPFLDDSDEGADYTPLVYVKPTEHVFPSHVPYVIIGAGTSGFAAARAIRASDPTSKILMISGGHGPEEFSEPGIPETNNLEPPPYVRPALSKELWRRSGDNESRLLRTEGDIRRHSWLFYEAECFFLKPEDLDSVEYGGVALARGDPVASLNPDERTVTLASGRQLTYDRCLIATGGHPKRLKQLEVCDRTGVNLADEGYISYFRSLADYKRLRSLVDKYRQTGGRIAIIGGGFLGSELSISMITPPRPSRTSKADTISDSAVNTSDKPKSASDRNKLSVYHIFHESVPMGHVLPPCLAAAVGRFESANKVDLLPSSDVISIALTRLPTPATQPITNTDKITLPVIEKVVASTNRHPIKLRVRRNEAGNERVEEIEVDHVVCAVGIEPNTNLAHDAGLELDPTNGGFLVNAEMEARAGVYVAGDAASYWDPVIGCRRRVEHLNFAEESGALAGKNMASSLAAGTIPTESRLPTPYQYQSSVWSTLGPTVSWDAVGSIDSRHLITRSFFASDQESGQPDKNSDSQTSPKQTSENSYATLVPESDFGHLTRGVTFYLTPKERKLVGILLWNLSDEIYTDKEYAAPRRLNVARSLLAERRLVGRDQSTGGKWSAQSEDQELQDLCRHFDLYGEIAEDYAQLKTLMEAKSIEEEERES